MDPLLSRSLDRVLGDGTGTPVVPSAVLDALNVAEMEVVDDISTTTPAPGRTATHTVPERQLWLVYAAESFQDTDAVKQTIGMKPKAGGVTIRAVDGTPAANVKQLWQAPGKPWVLWPGGTMTCVFAAGTLNATSDFRVLIQRVYL